MLDPDTLRLRRQFPAADTPDGLFFWSAPQPRREMANDIQYLRGCAHKGMRIARTLQLFPLTAASGDFPMINPFLHRVVVASLALTAGAALLGCNENAAGTTAVAQPKTVAREECHDEVTTHTATPKDKHQIAGTAIGAVVGGVIGNQFGGGDGKKLATVGGAVAGGYAGNKIQENNQEKNTFQETKRVCKTVYDRT